jgi:hypothetical protein
MKTKRIGASIGASEASGVTRNGNDLLVVSDAAPGAYFSFDVSGERSQVIRLPPDRATRHELSGAALAVDFEAVDVLGDGRIVALSERLRSLIGASGLVVQYDDPLSELGERGLEGLSVLANSDGSSEVAVLWEGGWVEDGEVQAQLRSRLGEPLLPVVLTHRLGRGETGIKVVIEDDRDVTELKVPLPDSETAGWRFRAPDMTWHEWRGENSATERGFIVLLNSQTARQLPGKPKFGPRWLQRFDRTGNPVGRHLDIDEEARKMLGDDRLRDANWEGIGWYETGRRLVLVHDEPNLIDGLPVALVVEVPNSWL